MFSFITFSKRLLLWTFITGFYCASIINGHVYSTEGSFNGENKTPQQVTEQDVDSPPPSLEVAEKDNGGSISDAPSKDKGKGSSDTALDPSGGADLDEQGDTKKRPNADSNNGTTNDRDNQGDAPTSSSPSPQHEGGAGKPTRDLVEGDNISGCLPNVIEKLFSRVVIVLLVAICFFFVSLYVVYKPRSILNWFSKSEKEITDYNPQTPLATRRKRLSTDNTNPKSLNEPTFFDDTDTIQSLLRLTSTERPIGVTAFQDGNLNLNCGGSINLLSLAGPEGSDKSDLNQDAALAWRADGPHTRAPDWIVAVADGVTSSRSSELGSKFAVHQAINLLLKAYDDNIRAEQLGGFVFNEIQELFLRIGEQLKKHPLKYIPPNEYATTWKRNVKKGRLLQTTLALAWAKGNQFHYASLGDSGLELYSNNNLRFKMKECDLDTNKVEAFGPNGGYHKSLLQTNTIKLNDSCVLILCTDGILRGFKNDLSSLQNCDIHQQLLNLCDDNTRRKEFDDNLTVVKVAFTPISRTRS